MVYQEIFVQRNQHRIYVREHPGEEPTVILMHGFPDDLHPLRPSGSLSLATASGSSNAASCVVDGPREFTAGGVPPKAMLGDQRRQFGQNAVC